MGTGKKLNIFSFSLPEGLASEMERMMEMAGYQNRSEIIRDAIRVFMEKQKVLEGMEGIVEGVAVVLYSGKVGQEVHRAFHSNRNVFQSFFHVDFEGRRERCCDILMFRGPAEEVRSAVRAIESITNVENVRIVLG